MKYPLLIPIIGHGATDIIEIPKETITLNLFFTILIHNINLDSRKRLLIGSSIYHIAQDIPFKFKYIISSIIHYLWLKKPILSKLHLLLIHTPLHYIRIYFRKNKWKEKYIIGIITSIIGSILLENNMDDKLNKKLGELWWLSPVLSHIILTDIINKNYIINYKRNKYLKNIKKVFII
jgi:hypothetical protein